MLAAIRRKPFAKPEPREKLEYLLGRKQAKAPRPDFEAHAFEHVLCYQRRVHALKQRFMKPNQRTPLGVIKDWWDRTEAQMRAALHGHMGPLLEGYKMDEWWRTSKGPWHLRRKLA